MRTFFVDLIFIERRMKLSFRVLILMVLFMISLNSNTFGEDYSKAISENQEFLIPDNAVNGDYVGYIKAFPEYQELNANPFFSLTEGNAKYDISNNGLITIKNSIYLAAGTDTLSVMISKDGYKSIEVKAVIEVLSSDLCDFVDFSTGLNGDGSREKPYNHLSFGSGKTLLLKRTSFRTGGELVINGLSDLLIGAYGSGDKPSLVNNDGTKVLCIGGGAKNITIRDISMSTANYPGTSAQAGIRLYEYPAGAIGGSDNVSILNCEIKNVESGIVAVPGNASNLTIAWNHIHHVEVEGIYLKGNKGTNIIHACYIHDVNEKYYENQNETVSSGDNIQLDETENAVVSNCLIDRSNAGNKFCLIPGSSGLSIEIRNNYFIAYPGRPAIFWIGYTGICEGNTFRGGAHGFWGFSGTPEIRSNIFLNTSTSAIHIEQSQNTGIYNNLFYHNQKGITTQGPVWTAKNNIFCLSEGEIAFAKSGIISDYNLYDSETNNMFGDGLSSLNAYQTLSLDVNSMVADPGFLNPAAGDFRLTEESPAVGSGKWIHDYSDFEDRAFKNPPSIGPYEFFQNSTEPVDTIVTEPVDTTVTEPVDTTVIEPVDTTITEPVDTTVTDTTTNEDPITDDTITQENQKPVIVLDYDDKVFAGQVSVIDASNSYDPDENDQFTFRWIIPEGVSSSDTSLSIVKLLPSASVEKSFIEITLYINDGKAMVGKTFLVKVQPYKPDFKKVNVKSVQASNFQNPNVPENMIDSDPVSRWSAEGTNEWAVFEFEDEAAINYLKVGFLPGQKRESYFDIYASEDKINWDPVLLNESSCDFSGDLQNYDFPTHKSTSHYKYIKLVGHGNSTSDWNSFSEIEFYGNAETLGLGMDGKFRAKLNVYPNPASDMVHISIKEMNQTGELRIADISGRIVHSQKIIQQEELIGIYLNYKAGIYFIQLITETGHAITEKLVVQ